MCGRSIANPGGQSVTDVLTQDVTHVMTSNKLSRDRSPETCNSLHIKALSMEFSARKRCAKIAHAGERGILPAECFSCSRQSSRLRSRPNLRLSHRARLISIFRGG